MRLFSIPAALLLFASLLPGQAGRRAPGFSLPSSNSNQIDLADYRGKVVLIDVMKTDCPHCGPFAQLLERTKAKYGDRIAILSIAPAPDNPTTVARFTAANKITFPILYDCGQVVYSYVQPSPLNPSVALPHLYIVSRDGIILRDYVYGQDTVEIFEGKQLDTELDKILAPAARPAKKK